MSKSGSKDRNNGAPDLKRSRRRTAAVSALDRLPPHSHEAEQGILGCILLSPKENATWCMEHRDSRLSHSPLFYDLRHAEIYDALCAMCQSKTEIDVITLQQYLKDKNLLQQVGGIAYLSSLPDMVPSAANISYYWNIAQEKALLRKVLHTCTDVAGRIYDYQGGVDDLLNGVDREFSVFADSKTPITNGRFYSVDDLDSFNPLVDPNNRIGNRWICKSGKLLLPAASGAGKSSLAMQLLTLFALGKDFCRIHPMRPLSSIFIGDENDEGDLAEMFQGTRDFIMANAFDSLDYDEFYSTLRRNLKFWHCPALSGEDFLKAVEAELKASPRDIACLDPLVSFAGVDLTKQDSAAMFLRSGLSRISEETGVIWFIIHHTPKPQMNSGKPIKKKISEYQYAGAGSFDLPGWARTVMTLDESSDGIFRLILAKRGKRAGATHPDGTPTTMLWMRHAQSGIHWEQIEPPVEVESNKRGEPKEARLSMPKKIAGLNLHSFLQSIPTEGEGLRAIVRRLANWIASDESPEAIDAKDTTLRNAIAELVANRKLVKLDETYRKGRNA